MIFSNIEVFIVKYITRSPSLSNFDALSRSIKGGDILRLDAPNLFDLQLLSEIIFSKDDLEMVGKLKLCWSWRYLMRVWSIDVRKIR